MKKISKILILSFLCFFTLNSFAQLQASLVGPSTVTSGGTVVKGPLNAIDVPANSVLSYLPSGWTTGYTSDSKTIPQYKCFQYFTGATGSFNTVTIWSVNSSLTTPLDYTLKVELYSASETASTLGTTAVPLSSTTSLVQPVATGEMLSGLYNIYSYSIQIPTTTLASGWVSVQAQTASPEAYFYWLNTTSAPSNSCFQLNGIPRVMGLSLALGNSNPVPVSIWAIVSGFVLIAGVVTFRFWRRMI